MINVGLRATNLFLFLRNIIFVFNKQTFVYCVLIGNRFFFVTYSLLSNIEDTNNGAVIWSGSQLRVIVSNIFVLFNSIIDSMSIDRKNHMKKSNFASVLHWSWLFLLIAAFRSVYIRQKKRKVTRRLAARPNTSILFKWFKDWIKQQQKCGHLLFIRNKWTVGWYYGGFVIYFTTEKEVFSLVFF